MLKLFGASASAPFVDWVYQTSEPLLRPFAGIFPTARLEDPYLIEISAIFALIIYLIIHQLLSWIIDEIAYRSELRRDLDRYVAEDERRPRKRS